LGYPRKTLAQLGFRRTTTQSNDCNLVFPDGVEYDKKNRAVRTLRVNTLFSEIEPGANFIREKKKGNPTRDCLKCYSVHRTSASSHFLGLDLRNIVLF
jgi:hypothetical protein